MAKQTNFLILFFRKARKLSIFRSIFSEFLTLNRHRRSKSVHISDQRGKIIPIFGANATESIARHHRWDDWPRRYR